LSAEEGRDDRNTQCKKEVKKKMKSRFFVGVILSLLMISAIASANPLLVAEEGPTVEYLDLGDVVHQQPEIKTFDTELGTVTALANGCKIGELPDPVELELLLKNITTEQLPEADSRGASPISGTLGPYHSVQWGTIYLTQYEVVTVSLSWYPGSSEIFVGLKNLDTGVTSWGPGITGGSGTWQFSAWQTGNYAVVILNHSGETVTYNGYISW
jgi:hypothetical protein